MVLKVSLNTGINRIRLEFKGGIYVPSIFSPFVLIESDWNLKINASRLLQSNIAVLIESDWNLKKAVK